MTTQNRIAVAVTLSVTLLAGASAEAGEVYLIEWFSGVASVAGETIFPPPALNNDNVAGTSPNEIKITQKDYFGIGPVDLVMHVRPSGGTTEYVFTEGVQNNTGVDWTGYHIELGYGTGGSFVKSDSSDGLDFDAPDYDSDFFFNPSPGFFPDVDVTAEDVIASGGVHEYLNYADPYVFHIDVPDGIDNFTIRQSPLASGVPEPTTAAILLLAAPWLGRRRMKKPRR